MAMKLLMITQAVDEDDPVLGFTCGWIKALAEVVEKLGIVCLREGKHDISGNVDIAVMPKGKLRRFLFLRRHLKAALREKRIDAVLAHMCPVYAIVAGSSLKGKIPVGLWYAHSKLTRKLKSAVERSQVVFSCAEGSLPIRTSKLVVTGHGVDTEKFRLPRDKRTSNRFRFISVGRLAPIKRYEILFPALRILTEKLPSADIQYCVYGPQAGDTDQNYAKGLIRAASDANLSEVFSIEGPVPFTRVHDLYQSANILANMTPKSFDKAVLEACACGVPVFTTNANYRGLFGQYAETLIAGSTEPDEIASKLEQLLKTSAQEREEMGRFLREQILKYHSLDALMEKIVAAFGSIR